MTALHILAAWFAISPIAGLLIARCIPPSEDGEGLQGRGVDQLHFGSITQTADQNHV